VSTSGTGILGGFQVGYNKRYGTIVVGLVIDFDFTSINPTTSGLTTKLPWFGTTRAKFGYLYSIVAGLWHRRRCIRPGRAFCGRSHGQGATCRLDAGAGLEYQLGGGWSIGAEYLHIELDGPSVSAGGFSASTKAEADLGRGTLNYKF
jgi:hypothetical protein